jgi:hypothetical protein
LVFFFGGGRERGATTTPSGARFQTANNRARRRCGTPSQPPALGVERLCLIRIDKLFDLLVCALVFAFFFAGFEVERARPRRPALAKKKKKTPEKTRKKNQMG